MPHTKPKFVTEELTPPVSPASIAPLVPEEEAQEMKTEEIPSEPEKSPFAVTETNNIDNSWKFQEKGVFLKFFLVTFFATLLALTLAGGVYVYLVGTKKLDTFKQVALTPSPSASETPIPSLTPTADLSTYKISVLNGNGGIGVAGALKTIIEKVGFKVSNLNNADNFNFTDTLIQAKSSVPVDTISTLKASLDANYSVKVADQPLDAASTYDIVITVGSKK